MARQKKIDLEHMTEKEKMKYEIAGELGLVEQNGEAEKNRSGAYDGEGKNEIRNCGRAGSFRPRAE